MRKKLQNLCVLALVLLLPSLASAQYEKTAVVIPTDANGPFAFPQGVRV